MNSKQILEHDFMLPTAATLCFMAPNIKYIQNWSTLFGVIFTAQIGGLIFGKILDQIIPKIFRPLATTGLLIIAGNSFIKLN